MLMNVRQCLQMDKKCEPAATFSSRLTADTNKLNIEDRWHLMKMRVYDIRNPRSRRLEWCNSGKSKLFSIHLEPSFGKPYSTLKSSKFCPSAIIHVLKEVCDLLNDYSSLNGDLSDKQECQCGFDWPSIDNTLPRRSKRIRLKKGSIISTSSKCPCQVSPKRKTTSNPAYYTVRKNLSVIVREILDCDGEKARITNDNLYNRILEEYPEVSKNAEIMLFLIKESFGDLSESHLIARHYLEACASSAALKAFVRGCITSLKHIKRGEDLIIVNFPLLARVHAGLLHVIGTIKVLLGRL